MSGHTHALPKPGPESEEAIIRRVLTGRRVAVVGLSDDPTRSSFVVASYLKSQGYEILPVNPNHAQVLGQKSYESLADVPKPIDIVNVFRRPEHCADVARDAAAVGAKALWLQSGITNDAARAIAHQAGMDFIQNRCLMVEHGQHVTS